MLNNIGDPMIPRSFPALVLSVGLLGACSVLTPSTASTPSAPRTDTSAAASSGLSDANIAAIVVAANNADIAYADQALAKTHDADIRQFALMTKKDHESVNTAAVALVTRLKVTPVDNVISFDLRDDADVKRQLFRELDGFAFDSAYIHNEVTYHTKVLGAIDAALMPSAKNAELKELLIAVRPAVAAHLDHAVSLAAKKRVAPRR